MARTFRQWLSYAVKGLDHNGKRSYNEIYGYPDSLAGDAGFSRMWYMATRTGIGGRLTKGMSQNCWRQGIELYDSQEEDAKQIFVDELEQLKKSGMLNHLERVDTLNRIGRYAVLFVGVPDGKDPSEPVSAVAGGPRMLDKVFCRPFAYDSVTISKFNSDATSPRYGLPELYTLHINNRDQSEASPVKPIVAHWTRVIHLCENALESDFEGTGYLEPIYNNLLNLEKVCGGSSEAYFRNAKGKIAFELDKEFADFFAENEQAAKDHKENADNFVDEYKDHITVSGAKAHVLNTPMYTPKDTIMGNLWVISGYSRLPIRVLTGEGSGQLAGSEDRVALNSVIADRQASHCHGVAVELLERLAMARMISLPESYDLRFPLQEETSIDQQVKNNEIKAKTFKSVVETVRGADGMIDPTSALRCFDFKDVDIEELPELSEEEEPEIDDEPYEDTDDRSGVAA